MTSLQAFLSFLLRAPKFPFPLPLLTPATQAIPFINRADKVIRQACEQAHRGALVAGPEKEGELATTSLEFEYLHRKSRCEMLIGEDDISNDVITLGTYFSMFVYRRSRFRFALIGVNLTAQSRRGAIGKLEVDFKF